MTEERKQQLETRAWELSRANAAIQAEIQILQHGEYAREPEVIFEINELLDLVAKLSVVGSDLEGRARFTDEEELDDLFGPPPVVASEPPDPFPCFPPSAEDRRSIRRVAAWSEEVTF